VLFEELKSPGLRFFEAQALGSQAQALKARPSWAQTSLLKNNKNFWTSFYKTMKTKDTYTDLTHPMLHLSSLSKRKMASYDQCRTTMHLIKL